MWELTAAVCDLASTVAPASALGLHRPELRAWAMYDWANSAVMTTIIAAVFPFFYTAVAGAGLPEGVAYGRFQIGSAIAIAIIAIIFGVAATKFGAKPLVFVGLAVYMVISVLGYWMTTATHFLLLAMLVGTVQGGTQALSRSLFATLAPC